MSQLPSFSLSPYTVLLLAGLGLSLFWWTRLARHDPKLGIVYAGALLGAFTGAKLVYFAAEGWLYWDAPERWLVWATGKTILGALLGGYAGVELAKTMAGYRAPTGDLFALVAPAAIVLGRIGCLLHGCCLGQSCAPAPWALRDAVGVPRWPAVPIEIGFNLMAVATFLILRRARVLPGQHFHLYLIGYGLFRFAHECVRATPRLVGGWSGYHFAALAVITLGAAAFFARARARSAQESAPAHLQ